MNCKNCNRKSSGRFCSFCGQKNHKNRLGLIDIYNELIGVFLNYDKGLLRTIKDVLIKPDELINNYFEGKRIIYFNPFKLLLIVVIIKGFILKTTITYKEFSQFVTDDFYVFYQVGLFLIIFPLFSYLFYKKQVYNISEHIVLNTFYHATIGFVFILVSLFFFIFGIEKNLYAQLFYMLLEILFFVYFYFRVFTGNWFLKILKSLFVFLFSISLSSFIITIFY